MWESGNQKVVTYEDYNKTLSSLTDTLDDIQSRLTLAKFLKSNIGFTFHLLSGVELLPIQEIILKSILIRDVSIIVAGRGFSKSFLISVLSLLFPIFYPGSSMCLISSNFRSSRRILEMSEKMVTSKRARLLQACFENKMQRSNDIYRWKLSNGSECFALPLSTGEGLRGTRCHFLAIDEAINVDKEVQDTILRPFLTVKQNLQHEMEVRRQEDLLIKNGVITERDRLSFPKNKFCAFSSASFTFQHLYTMFQDSLEKIFKPDSEESDPPTYFAMRASYEALPENSLMDLTQIKAAAANGGENSAYFKREYKAMFSDSNDGYFSAAKLHACTVKVGNYPTTQIIGDKNSEYILSLDTSYSSSKASDFFAMGLYLINKEERKITLVHSYAKTGAGEEIKLHYEYLIYLLTYFNIVFMVIDDSGSEFIHGFNESTLAQTKGISLSTLKVDFDTDDLNEYSKSLQELKKQYNLSSRKFILSQKFNSSSGTIRRMNEHLQNSIEAQRVWFASSCSANQVALRRSMQVTLPFTFKNNKDQILGLSDFIDEQDDWIKETKAEVSLIQVESTSSGTLKFDLPQSLRHLDSPDRPKKDLYTCLLLSNWASKIYFDMIFTEIKTGSNTFSPIVIR